ncbi:MAG TPA: MarR family transcriptional regulator [Streptosporangiaceae bacterium]|nr:MarR family transcriptional regulator [Streptosporangiaceae bacterium]
MTNADDEPRMTNADDEPGDAAPLPALADRFAYLLKHAQLRLAELTRAALAPFGISGRELAVLVAIDDRPPASQQEVARRMGVDRTTMVALIDDLEDKSLVQRQQDPDDRRKNVVVLTDAGHATLREATVAAIEAERRLLGSLSDEESAMLRKALQAIAFPG